MGEILRSVYARITKLTMRVKAIEEQLVRLVERVGQLEEITGAKKWEVEDWT